MLVSLAVAAGSVSHWAGVHHGSLGLLHLGLLFCRSAAKAREWVSIGVLSQWAGVPNQTKEFGSFPRFTHQEEQGDKRLAPGYTRSLRWSRLLDPKPVPRQPDLCGTGRAHHAQWAAHGLGEGGDHCGWCLGIQRAISHYLLTQCATCTCCRNSVCFNHITKIALLLPKSISWRCFLHNIQGQILNKAISRVALTLEKM